MLVINHRCKGRQRRPEVVAAVSQAFQTRVDRHTGAMYTQTFLLSVSLLCPMIALVFIRLYYKPIPVSYPGLPSDKNATWDDGHLAGKKEPNPAHCTFEPDIALIQVASVVPHRQECTRDRDQCRRNSSLERKKRMSHLGGKKPRKVLLPKEIWKCRWRCRRALRHQVDVAHHSEQVRTHATPRFLHQNKHLNQY